MSRKPTLPRALTAALIPLLALAFAAPAGASPAGGSGVRPFAEVEPTIEKPADRVDLLNTPVTLNGVGTGMAAINKTEGLPAGLEAKVLTPTEWRVEGEPTLAAAAKPVTIVVENAEHKTVETTFNWAIAGVNSPGNQTTVVNAEVKIPVTGHELASLTEAPGKLLPGGLTLEKVSEDEWQIVGTPTTPTETKVELQAKNAAEVSLAHVEFDWTVAGINSPGTQTGTVGLTVSLPIKGAGLKELIALKPLPAGLSLKKVSDAEWLVEGTPSESGKFPAELQGEDQLGATFTAAFEWTIAAAETPPPPKPPSATGTLRVSPAGAFSAAKATCSGLTWSPSTVSTQWLLDGLPIAGATATTYVAPRIDDGRQLSCRQTAVTGEGARASVTSAAATVHEQPPQPYWAIGLASQRCSGPVCMQDGQAAQTPVTRTYQQAGSWMAASQIRCISAPWTSIAGTSGVPAVERLAEAHSVTVTLVRTTAAGAVGVVSQELSNLTSPSEGIDGAVPGSPFAGNIVSSFGSQTFAPGELWPRLFPGSLGKPDRFAAGQGYIAYQVNPGPAVPRSFQLVYNLTAADLGAHLHCTVSAKDGPAASPTTATLTSPEYAVTKASSCAPRQVAHIGGPQPATVVVGSRPCLKAPSGLSEIGNGPRDLSVVAGRSAIALECALGSGCAGKLTLTSGGRNIAGATVSLRRGAGKVVSLKLDSEGRARLRKAGSAGLTASLNLVGKSSKRRVSSVTLLSVS